MEEKQSVGSEYAFDSGAKQGEDSVLFELAPEGNQQSNAVPAPMQQGFAAGQPVQPDNAGEKPSGIAAGVQTAEANEGNVGPFVKGQKGAQKQRKRIAKLRKQYKIDDDELLSQNEVVAGFVIAKNEKVVRSYDCLAAGRGTGAVVLTTKRLLINAGERSELPIDSVKGIRFSRNTMLSVVRFIFGVLFIAAGVFALLVPSVGKSLFSSMRWCNTAIKVLLYIAGAIAVCAGLPLAVSSVSKSFYFMIYAEQTSAFLDYKSPSDAKRESKGKACKSVLAKAGKESDKAARELGALILEIKEGRYTY